MMLPSAFNFLASLNTISFCDGNLFKTLTTTTKRYEIPDGKSHTAGMTLNLDNRDRRNWWVSRDTRDVSRVDVLPWFAGVKG
jgi:hypothetical protein